MFLGLLVHSATMSSILALGGWPAARRRHFRGHDSFLGTVLNNWRHGTTSQESSRSSSLRATDLIARALRAGHVAAADGAPDGWRRNTRTRLVPRIFRLLFEQPRN
jgi:hypothetical protein